MRTVPRRSFLFGLVLAATATATAQDIRGHDVVWRTPSTNSAGSMPIGNGEVGCNVWYERYAGLRFHVARTDSFSEASRLLKLGSVWLQVLPPRSTDTFAQRLVLEEGRIEITLGDGAERVVLNVFVDSGSDVVHVTSESETEHLLTGTLTSWRTDQKRLRGDELASSWTMKDAPKDIEVIESVDTRVERRLDGLPDHAIDARAHLGWFHHNEHSVVATTAQHQGLLAAQVPDVLRGRTFGLLTEAAFGAGERTTLGVVPFVLPSARHHELRIAAPCRVVDDPAQWIEHGKHLLAATDSKTARQRTAAWWRSFWQRSWIVTGSDGAAPVPTNAHPLRIGVDSNGGNRFVGTIARVMVQGGPFSADLSALAIESPFREPLLQATPGKNLPVFAAAKSDLDFSGGLRVIATITQDDAHPIGRIVDKVTAGTGDGFLFDTHPGRALRLIVGDRQLVANDVLQAGKEHVVMAQYDDRTGRMQLACDGKVVADSAGDDELPKSRLTQALVLQRWVQACGGRGQFPIKFNGSIFTVEPVHTGGQQWNADWRRWGDCFWWQNTRLPYYPMLAQGDLDMQAPLFAFYRRTLPLAAARAKTWHGVDGAYWPETMTPFGTHANGDYGWVRGEHPVSKVLCPWWEYARNQGLELLALLLDRHDFERDDAFFTREVLPVAEPVLAWFANAYPRAADGTLRITPTQALETHWHGVENDLPTVAGLHWCLARLRQQAGQLVPEPLRERWAALEKSLPAVPTREVDGVRMLAPAAKYDPSRQNVESPELSAVFPFRLYGLGKPDLEVARAAFRTRHDKHTNGWPQDGQVAALLGLVDDAWANVLGRLQNSHRAHRFPVMWGPNFDWLPDQCHGSNLLDTVQRMLLQCDDGTIRVLPCWPRDRDVSFKLHAPMRTTVECTLRAGKITRLEVSPASRRADVVLPPGW